jgi:hypothetical protein
MLTKTGQAASSDIGSAYLNAKPEDLRIRPKAKNLHRATSFKLEDNEFVILPDEGLEIKHGMR